VRPLLGRVLMAIALFGLAAILVAESRRLDRSADLRQRFATLRYDAGDTPDTTDVLSAWLPESGFGSARGAAVDRATATYWQARYDALAGAREAIDRDPDPELLLLAANAAFRASQQKVQPRQDQARDLDLVLQAYATVLKANVFVPDAAYNYEYVVRLRDFLARPRAGTPLEVRPADAVKTELPPGPTIHGRPGGPPPRTKGEEFEILAPMEFGDREAQPEPTGGARPLRKG
jgi:hypothetical protein